MISGVTHQFGYEDLPELLVAHLTCDLVPISYCNLLLILACYLLGGLWCLALSLSWEMLGFRVLNDLLSYLGSVCCCLEIQMRLCCVSAKRSCLLWVLLVLPLKLLLRIACYALLVSIGNVWCVWGLVPSIEVRYPLFEIMVKITGVGALLSRFNNVLQIRHLNPIKARHYILSIIDELLSSVWLSLASPVIISFQLFYFSAFTASFLILTLKYCYFLKYLTGE